MVRKYIPIIYNDIHKYQDFEIFTNYFKLSFCNYLYKKGSMKGCHCHSKTYNSESYCKKHFLLLRKTQKNKDIKEKIQRCKYNTINGTCNRICRYSKDFCFYHKGKKYKSTIKNIYEKIYVKKSKNAEQIIFNQKKPNIENIIIKDKFNSEYYNFPKNKNLQLIIYKKNPFDDILMKVKKLKKKDEKIKIQKK